MWFSAGLPGGIFSYQKLQIRFYAYQRPWGGKFGHILRPFGIFGAFWYTCIVWPFSIFVAILVLKITVRVNTLLLSGVVPDSKKIQKQF
jgi:hypothetical protein